MKNFLTVALVLKPNNIESLMDFLPHLLKKLFEKNCHIQILNYERERIIQFFPQLSNSITFVDKKDFAKNASLIVSLGGDGTLIGLCRDLNQNHCPIFSINLGRLGFLTEFSVDNYLEELDRALVGNFHSTTVKPFTVRIMQNEKEIFSSIFLNDIVIGRSAISRLINFNIFINNELVFDIFGDGVIVSTPHGSTAYSLSAGGPIIHPNVNALAITPICPHTLNSRPLVIPNNDLIEISGFSDDNDILLTVDGQLSHPIKNQAIVLIERNNQTEFILIKNPRKTYLNNLKEKFIHGKRL